MIYKAFEPTDIVAGRSIKVSSGLFETGSLYLSQSRLSTSSLQSTISGSNRYDVYNGYYYLDVFPDAQTTSSADQLFSITYGNKYGYGTGYDEYANLQIHPTKAIWTQYYNELTNGEGFYIKYQSGSGTNTYPLQHDFIAIKFNPQKFKDLLDPGQFQINFQYNSADVDIDGNPLNDFGWCTRVIDDSTITGISGSTSYHNLINGEINPLTGEVQYFSTGSTVGKVYTGEAAEGIIHSYLHFTSSISESRYNPYGIGLFYPKAGTLIFNPNVFATLTRRGFHGKADGSAVGSNSKFPIPIPYDEKRPQWDYGFGGYSDRVNEPTASLTGSNYAKRVFNLLKDSADALRVRKSEYVPSRHYFIRVKNREFNYSNNPTFTYQTAVIDANGNSHQRGDIKQTDFLTDPRVYVTSVGLYNENNELLAVGKLSRPAMKSFQNELLIKVRLDF